ncbi:S66 family peptidase [Falsibacillus albus]|uniref:LD-carboxypeptidase n=1 Tax=Falsibacillus albus TaxID=2478915 RepID=A0A3L7JX65_9BACI|nr:S66 peptidase family protein [Falsibacillus albus]RLQ95377.1 LD-carboxypeptidase [Falsibacillus albus]
MIKPQRLKKGDAIGIISPSAGVAAVCPRRFERGVKTIESMGLKVKCGRNALKKDEYMAGSIEERVEDLHVMFQDPEVKAIITTIGGTCSHQMLEYLDFAMIRDNPKIFMGYSDITALHLAISKRSQLVTYLGPAILPQFGEFGGLLSYTNKAFEDLLVKGNKVEYKSSHSFIMEHLWWDKEDNRKRDMTSNPGMKVLKEGTAEGEIIAANMGVMLLLAGTSYFPDLEGKILCIEDDEGETPSSIDRYLTQMRQMGIFGKISGLVVGRFHSNVGFKEGQLESILQRVTTGYNFPVIIGADFGHTDPMMILPNGIQASLKASNINIDFRLTESPVNLEKIS